MLIILQRCKRGTNKLQMQCRLDDQLGELEGYAVLPLAYSAGGVVTGPTPPVQHDEGEGEGHSWGGLQVHVHHQLHQHSCAHLPRTVPLVPPRTPPPLPPTISLPQLFCILDLPLVINVSQWLQLSEGVMNRITAGRAGSHLQLACSQPSFQVKIQHLIG